MMRPYKKVKEVGTTKEVAINNRDKIAKSVICLNKNIHFANIPSHKALFTNDYQVKRK